MGFVYGARAIDRFLHIYFFKKNNAYEIKETPTQSGLRIFYKCKKTAIFLQFFLFSLHG
jgi:hypothetical protein